MLQMMHHCWSAVLSQVQRREGGEAEGAGGAG